MYIMYDEVKAYFSSVPPGVIIVFPQISRWRCASSWIRDVVIYVAIHCKHACFLNLCMTSNGSNASEYMTEKGGE